MNNVIKMEKYRTRPAKHADKSFMWKTFTAKDLVTGVKFSVAVYYYKYTDGSASIEYYTLDDDDISREELTAMLGHDKMLQIDMAVCK